MLQTERIGQGARNVRHDERPDRRTAGLREAIPPGLCGIRNASPLEQARTWRANAGGCPGSGARLAHRGQPRSAAVGGTDRTGLPCHSLRNDATITSHCLWWRCGAGTPACWVETHLDPLRERHPPSRQSRRRRHECLRHVMAQVNFPNCPKSPAATKKIDRRTFWDTPGACGEAALCHYRREWQPLLSLNSAMSK